MFEFLELYELSEQKCGMLRKPSSTRPALWIVEENGRRAVVKDFSSNSFIYRNIIGRFLVWREKKAYRRLRGLKGIPQFYRTIDGLALVIEEIAGKNMEGLEKETMLSEHFFRELRLLVENIHRRGLAHCDLKRAPNIMIDNDGKPYIVDWSASISKSEFGFFPLNLIYKRFALDDFNAIIKIKLRHCPECISYNEKRRYYKRSKVEKYVRSIRDKTRDLLQRIV